MNSRSLAALLLVLGTALCAAAPATGPPTNPPPTSPVVAPVAAVEPVRRVRLDRFAAIDEVARPDDFVGNRQRLLARVAAAAAAGARYVVLPELGLTGPLGPGVDPHAEPIPGPTTEKFAEVARRHGLWIALSLAEVHEGDPTRYAVTSVLLDHHGAVVNRAQKRVLRPDGSDGAAVVGFARVLLDTVDDRGRRLGIVSGDDLQDGVRRLAARGADTLLVTARWSSADPVPWRQRAAKLAAEFKVNLVVANGEPGLSGIWERTGRTVVGTETPLIAALGTAENGYRVVPSLGLPASVPLPTDQPFSPELVEFGRELFFDPKLSSTGDISCSSCHKPELQFSDGRAVGEGVYGRKTQRNAPSLLNVAFRTPLQWDGNPTTIEQQFKYPLSGFAELNARSYEELYAYILSRPKYLARIRSELGIAPEEFTREHVAMVLGAFLRTLVSGSSPFDRYFYGADDGALEPAAVRGLELFRGRARCVDCHRMAADSALFMDSRFHRLGIGYVPESGLFVDPGVGVVSNSDYAGMFFTPPLRNVAETAPYLHDGSAATLEEAIRRHYTYPKLDPTLVAVTLDETDVRDLVAFLRSLTGVERYDERGRKLVAGLAPANEGTSRARSRRLIGRGR